MLSLMLLLKQTKPRHSCSQNTPLAQDTQTNRLQCNITHIQRTSILSALLPPSAVHDPTTSFNPFHFHPNTTTSFCQLVIKICQSLHSFSCTPSLEQIPASVATNIWPILRTHPKLTSSHISTALSLQSENTALYQILSWFILFPLPPSRLDSKHHLP